MGDTLSEYIHMLVDAILFASAVSLLMVGLGQLNQHNRMQIDSIDKKTSVASNVGTGYSDDILISGAEVYTDIINSVVPGANIKIVNGATTFKCNKLDQIKLEDDIETKKLRDNIVLDKSYKIRYTYDDKNEIYAVEYTLQP